MNSRIEIIPEHLDIVIKILDKHLNHNEVKVYAFGSRTKSTAKRRSDLDLALKSKTPIPYFVITSIKNEFENSLLPYEVDMVDLDKLSPEFMEAIKDDLTELRYKT